ncbi:MAG: ABC transporter permease, partial [Caldilinea sp.]|nr:ABC transporter permease [Caldilinea sp.]MDW8440118.1 ABC transporter permease [Caldilineaceae bacterium]
MQYTLQQIFRSGKFVVGFSILVTILLIVLIYPLLVRHPPLQIIAQGTFFPPGIYVNVYDAINAPTLYTLNLEDAAANRIGNRLRQEDRVAMKEWLVAFGIPEEEIDITDTEKLLALWNANYDPELRLPGMTFARQRYFQRVDAALDGLLSTEPVIIAAPNSETGALEQKAIIRQ